MKKRLFVLAVFLIGIAASAQISVVYIQTVTSNPSGSCPASIPWRYNKTNGTGWYCGSVSGTTGTWTQIGSAAGGDSISSPNGTITVGGTSTATTVDVANAATFNNSGSGAASGTTYNGSAARTVSYNTIGAQQALTLTTTGTSGAATLSSGTLNIPQYSGGSGTFNALTGDATSTSTGGATTVVGLNGTLLSGLATGIVKNTTATGVPSIAVAGDFPTLNQNTTGSAAKWTTARNLAGNSVDGSANVAFANKFILQGTADAGLSGAQFLGALATGPLCNTITTGVLTACAAGSYGVSGMTATQVPIAASANTITSSKALAGSGTGITTGPTSSTNLDCVEFTGTAGQIADAGGPCGSGGFANPMTTLGDIIDGGASGTATRLAGPTVGTVPYMLTSTPSGGVAQAPAWGLPGVPGRTVSGTTDTVAATDRSTSIDFSSAPAVAETFTSPATLGNNFSSAEHNIAAGLVTMTLGAGNFLTTGASTKALANGEWCATSSPDNTNIDDRCASGLTTTDATLTPTRSAAGIQLGVALGHANTWSALQTFGANASIAATAHGVLLSENTSAVVATSAGTTGQCLTSNGASSDPTFQTCGVGSGVSSLTGDGTIITNNLSTGAVTLAIAGTSGGIPYFSSATGWASTALLTNHGLLVGGGAGAGPAALAVGGANFPLIGQASANPTFSTIAYPTSMTTGQLVYGSSSTALAATGVNLSWSSPTLTIGVAGTTTGNLTLASSTATGSVTLTPASAASAFTATLPANTGTVGELNLAETWSALQTFGTNISIGGVTAAGATGTTNVVFSNSPTLVTPTLGAATATSLIASGIVDGEAPITLTTGASCTLGTASGCNATAYDSGYTFNQEATAATAITYTLPTAAAGKQYCVGNSYNGSAATTGTLEILTSASGQFIIFTDGTLSATGGYVLSGGAAGDAACVVGTDSTHWQLYVQRGTWAKH